MVQTEQKSRGNNQNAGSSGSKTISLSYCMGSGAKRLKTGAVETGSRGMLHLRETTLPGLVCTQC